MTEIHPMTTGNTLIQVALTINGTLIKRTIEARTSLAELVRCDLGLTGTHLGCEHGVCGACTILLDGAPARACISFVAGLEGRDVRTVEGFEQDALMKVIRNAFQREHALQCGFCTPGMLVTARDIVTRLEAPDEQLIRTELAGNLCRCTGYQGIVNAIQRVIREVPVADRLASGRSPAMSYVCSHLTSKPFKAFAAQREIASSDVPVVTDQAGVLTAQVIAAGGLHLDTIDGWSQITDMFVIDRSLAVVWEMLGHMERVTRCVPGANFTSADGRTLDGQMHIAFGPIQANFECRATHLRDDLAMSGSIEGEGGDARRGSRAKGRVTYRLFGQAATSTTRVELTMDYQLQGPLAQFGRSGLVRDFTRRIIAAFAANLCAELSGGNARPQQRLSIVTTLTSILWARLKKLFGAT